MQGDFYANDYDYYNNETSDDDYYNNETSDDAIYDADNWKIHSNEFSNPFSLYEMSSAEVNAYDAFKINATNNFFTLTGQVNISSPLIDNRLFDDNEDPSNPEILFEPYLTKDIPIVCPSNCTENGLCVFPGICICKDGWSGASCDTPTCATLNFCNGNGICR